MPIATARDLRADARPGQAAGLRLPGDQRHLEPDAERRAEGVRRRGQRRHRPGLHRRRRVPVGPVGQGHGDRRDRAGRVRARRGGQVPGPHRPAHRPLPEGQARRLHAPAGRRSPASGSSAARSRCSSRTCGTARRCRWPRTCRSPPNCSPSARRRTSSWRWRSASSAARRTGSSARSTRSCTPRRRTPWRRPRPLGLGERGRYILAATFGNVHGVYKPGHVKLRPSILQGHPGRRGPEVRQGQAVQPGLPRRVRVGPGGDQGGHLLRRGQDEHRHRHPVRVHPAGRRATCSTNYDGVLKVDGDVGNKKVYDPRCWGKAAEAGMAARVTHGLRGPDVGRAPPQGLMDTREPAGGPAPRPYLPSEDEAAAALEGGTPPQRCGALPGVLRRLGGAGRARLRRGRRGRPPTRTRGPGYHRGLDQLRRAGGGERADPVGARAEPRLPAFAAHAGAAAGAIGEDDEAAAVRAVPARQQPRRGRGAAGTPQLASGVASQDHSRTHPGASIGMSAGFAGNLIPQEPLPRLRLSRGFVYAGPTRTPASAEGMPMPAIVAGRRPMGRRGQGQGHRPARRPGRLRGQVPGRQQRRAHGRHRRGEATRCTCCPPACCRREVVPVIGNGVVIDPQVLLDEIDALAARGVDCGRLLVSRQRAPDHALPPGAGQGDRAVPGQRADRHHRPRHRPRLRRQDRPGRDPRPGPVRSRHPAQEARPRAAREEPGARQGLQPARHRPGRRSPPTTERYAERLRPYVADTGLVLGRALDEGKVVLLEGAQATMLDVDHGTLPVRHLLLADRGRRLRGLGHRARPGSPRSSGSSRRTRPASARARSPPNSATSRASGCARPARSTA